MWLLPYHNLCKKSSFDSFHHPSCKDRIPTGLHSTAESRLCCATFYSEHSFGLYRRIGGTFCIMPNHIHILLRLPAESTTTIPTIIRSFKRMTTRELGVSIWQDSYYDVIIRNDSMFQSEWNYIDCNPDKWAEDPLYVTDLQTSRR